MSATGDSSNEPYQIVEAYGPGRFRVSGTVHETSVIVFAERTIPWSVARFGDLGAEDFAPVLEMADELEILLLGCGPRMELVPSRLRDPLRARGVVIEPMDTGAAARTFNLLLSEDRQVAAALIALPDDTPE
ncbi:MAG: Mth938-like domain-containing protein [Alphaproteobacteria bacterium]|nr:Mth938-like domain-containing protein [Alphaproteobacteria bacterium]